MSLIKSNTKWVLFLASSQVNSEERHILDLTFGLACLEKSGVRRDNIYIYIDGNDRKQINNLIHLGTINSYKINTSKDFFTEMRHNSHDNLVMFVTGHGSENGIDSTTPITPFFLLNALKTAPKLEKAIVYLGQCFAGIFNYVKAGKQSEKDPNIVFIGATELQESLSSYTTETFSANSEPISWLANLFLLYVFKWVSSPFDVDGDKFFTIMDSYKYAGVMTNRSHKNVKAHAFIGLMDAYGELRDAIGLVKNPTGDPQEHMHNKLKLRAMEQKYVSNSHINNVHQECWILNSIPAQQIEI